MTDDVPDSRRGVRRRTALKGLSGGVAAAGLSGLAGCIGGGGSASTYTMGVHLPLSKGYGVLGKSFTNALKLARDEINAAGGIGGKTVEFVVEDNKVDPQTGVEKLNKMIKQDGIDVLLGPVNSSMRNALSPIVKQNEIPMLYWLSYEGPTAEDYCNEYLFKFGEIPSQQWKPAVPWMMENFGDSFFLIGKDDSYSRILHRVVKETVRAEGGEILDDVYAPINHTEWGSTLSNLKAADPDVLYSTVVGKSVGALQTQLYNRGLREGLAEVGSAYDPVNLAGTSAAESAGTYNSLAYFKGLDNQANNRFVTKFHEQYGSDSIITAWTGLAYNTLKMFQRAMEGADSGSTDEVLSRLPGTQLDGVVGNVSMGPDHQIDLRSKILEINENTQFEFVRELPRATIEDRCSGF